MSLFFVNWRTKRQKRREKRKIPSGTLRRKNKQENDDVVDDAVTGGLHGGR